MKDKDFYAHLDRSDELEADRRVEERLKQATKKEIEQLVQYCPASVRYDPRWMKGNREPIIEWVTRSKLYTFVDINSFWGGYPKIKNVKFRWKVFGNKFSKIAHLSSCVPYRNSKSYSRISSQAQAESWGYRPCKNCNPFRLVPKFVHNPDSRTLHAINCGCPKLRPTVIDLERALKKGYNPCPILADYIKSL